MDRTSIKVSPQTAGRFRDTVPELSAAAGRMLTHDQALAYLLDNWAATVTRSADRARAGRLAARGPSSGPR